MGQLHAREQEAVDLVYYLWKAYKAAPDDEFVTYIKDLKSQCDDGRATFMVEDLIVRELDLAMCVSPSSNGSKMRSLWTNQMKS